MSPKRFHDDHHESSRTSREMIINGPRPSPLKISKDSHTIHKPSSYSSNLSSSSTSSSLSSQQQQQQRHPIIIYTHSPKVIHTQARDFMALVQKLTGLSQSGPQNGHETAPAETDKKTMKKQPDNERDEKVGDVRVPVNPPTNPFLVDIPLFTPTATDFFFSPRPMYRFSEHASPSMSNPISPSVFEFLKELPEC